MSNLILHRGGKVCSLNELRSIPTPKPTSSYTPVAHHDLATTLRVVASDYLPGYTIHNEQYGIAREGAQLFGVHTYRNGCTELGLSIGFRNSLDKSLSVGLAFGASVFVCDNLALQGSIMVMRKHTTNVWRDLEELIVSSTLQARTAFHQTRADTEEMKQLQVNDAVAWQVLGFLYGKKVLTTRQLPVALKEWHEPRHPDFKPRSLWSLYNACTEALKASPPQSIMERHLLLHSQLFEGRGRWLR